MSSPSPRPVAPRRARPIFEGPTYKAPRYHSRIWGRLIFLMFVLLLAVVIGAGGGTYWLLHRPQSSSAQLVGVHIGSGDSVSSIATRLNDKGLISNTLLFKLDARIQNLGGKLKVGDYTVRKNMSIDEMVAALQQYNPIYVSFTVPEGWRAEQIAAGLSARGFDGRGFLRQVQSPSAALLRSLNAAIVVGRPARASLEGYLFPDTYHLSPGETGGAIIKEMVGDLNTKFTPAMIASAKKQGRSVYQTLTLASIVEREARVPLERPRIAGIYINRLTSSEVNDRLQADPTVQYTLGSKVALGTAPSKAHIWWPVLQDQAVNINPTNPYNTYTHQGLPPGPIADPGLASIRATVYPEKTSYLYFVAKKGGHGTHAFATTYQQQLVNQQKYG